MNEEGRNEDRYLVIKDRVTSSTLNYEAILRQAHFVYECLFNRYMKSSGDERQKLKILLEKLSKSIDGTVLRLETSIDRFHVDLGGID